MITRRAAIFGLAALGASLLFGCQRKSFPQINKIMYLNPYDWDGLLRAGDRLAYYEDDILCSRWGIDVSEHQGDIAWNLVSEFGVQFAFVRIGNRGATAGALNTDAFFADNAIESAAARIDTYGYFFSQSINEAEAIEEADYAISQVEAANAAGASVSMIAFDHEPVNVEGARANNLSPEQLSANALAFCERVEQAGFKALLYGNQRDLAKFNWELRRKYPVWLAEYDVDYPTAEMPFDIWQYSNSGTVAGINTRVDLNIWFT